MIQNLIDSMENEWFFYYLKDVISNVNEQYSQYSSILLNIFENLPSINPNLTDQERAKINLNDFKLAVQVAFTYGNYPDFHDPKKDQMDSYIAKIKPSLSLLSSLYDNKSDVELDTLEELRKDLSYITDNYSLRSDLNTSEIQDFITKYSDHFSLDELEELYIEIYEQKQTSKIVQKANDMEKSSNGIVSISDQQELDDEPVLLQEEIVSAISEELFNEYPELDYEENDELEQVETIVLGIDEKINILANIIYREIENDEERQQKVDDYIQKIGIVRNIFSSFNANFKEYRHLYEDTKSAEMINFFNKVIRDFITEFSTSQYL